MSGVIAGLAGAPGAATNAGNYYTNAANQIISATGSPAASQFASLEQAQLEPRYQQMINQAASQAAAMGITGSGAGRANLGDVAAQNAATLSGSVAPLYSQALGQYGQIIGAMPGAQNQAYQQAITDLYQAIGTGASAAGAIMGIPGLGGSSGLNLSGGLPSSSDIMVDQGYNYYNPANTGTGSLGQQAGMYG